MVKTICGIDEAGRGPIIGPLVMAGILIKEKDIEKLEKIKVRDSKLLTKEQREEFFEKIKKIVLDFRIKILEPDVIDAALKSSSLNLNWLEANTSAEIVEELKPDKAIIDCPSNNIGAYREYFINKIKEELRDKVEIVMEHRADLNYVVVAAASIIAKVIRDREIEKIKQKYAIEFGSGYPSDPLTVEFLKQNYDKYPDIFRKTWVSYKRLASKSQTTLDKFK